MAAAGGLPVPLTHEPGLAAAQLVGLDGLVVTGGAFDVPPELYGEARRPGCGRLVPERTASELAAPAGRRWPRGLPVLGVCGGMQLLAVAHGGTLWQDLPAEAGLDGHEQPPPKDAPSHPVEVEAGTRLAGAGRRRARSPSTRPTTRALRAAGAARCVVSAARAGRPRRGGGAAGAGLRARRAVAPGGGGAPRAAPRRHLPRAGRGRRGRRRGRRP